MPRHDDLNIKEPKYLIEVQKLKTAFRIGKDYFPAVEGVSFNIEPGKVVALVGESGCGKSVTSLSLMRLIDEPGKILSGHIYFKSYRDKNSERKDLLELDAESMRKMRGSKIAMIFQEPMTSLNPVFTVGNQIMEAILLHQAVSKEEARERAIAMLKKVKIPDPEKRIDDYPHQLSGGMRQRVMIAMALSCEPELLIADEPTTALDVTVQAQILDLIRELVQEEQMSVLLITHDMGVVAQTCDEVMVMYAGQIVESARVKQILQSPKHPYTQGLLRSIPSLYKKGERLETIPGKVPSLAEKFSACKFLDRCNLSGPGCFRTRPVMKYVGDSHYVRCLNY